MRLWGWAWQLEESGGGTVLVMVDAEFDTWQTPGTHLSSEELGKETASPSLVLLFFPIMSEEQGVGYTLLVP